MVSTKCFTIGSFLLFSRLLYPSYTVLCTVYHKLFLQCTVKERSKVCDCVYNIQSTIFGHIYEIDFWVMTFEHEDEDKKSEKTIEKNLDEKTPVK